MASLLQRNPAQGSKTKLPFALPSDDAILIPWLKVKKDAGRPVVSDAQLKLNLAYVLGYQWVTWDSRTRAYRRPTLNASDPNAPVRVKSNKIGTLVERSIAKLTKNAPLPEGRPVSDDDNDVDAARVASRILDHELDRLNWNTFLQKFMFWPYTLGWSYVHVGWNPDGGDAVGADPDDPDAPVMQGDTTIEEVPAFELRVDPSAKDMQGAKWAVRSSAMTSEEVWMRWDVDIAGGSDRSLSQEVYALGGSDHTMPAEDWVTVNQIWVVPCKIAPKGAVITWANEQILERKDFPYDHDTLPFVQFNCLPGLGTREGRTWVTDMLDLQTDYNDNLSREATIRRSLTPKLVAAVGQVDPARITSRVDVLSYMPGITAQPPHYEFPNAQWAQQFELGMNRDEKDMGDRSGVGEASSGHAASTAPAASILALQDADDTKLRLTATEMSAGIQEIGRQLLLLAKQFWSEDRLIRTWSQEDILAAYRYTGADIDDRLDVHVSSESSMPKSKAARTQMVLDLAKMFPKQFSAADVVRFLEMPGLDHFVRHDDVDTRKQYRENSQMLGGDNPAVQAFDNHLAHLVVLNDFRKSSDYERLDTDGQARFDAHAAVHESLVLKQMGLQVPTPQPEADPAAAAQAQQADAGPAGFTPPPSTGQPPPGLGVPQADLMSQQNVHAAAGIAQGAGHPGQVPGIPADMQANSMGH